MHADSHADWDLLSDAAQVTLAAQAMAMAADVMAERAELLAGEFDAGALSDRGGAEALRLLAALVRAAAGGSAAVAAPPAGRA